MESGSDLLPKELPKIDAWDGSSHASGRKFRMSMQRRARPSGDHSRRHRGAGMILRGAALIFALAGMMCPPFVLDARAQDTIGKAKLSGSVSTPPMPPPRPLNLSAPPPLPAPTNGPPPGVDPMVADFAPSRLEMLPAASRARMHQCGAEWDKMKAAGATTDKTWLSFARVCLVR